MFMKFIISFLIRSLFITKPLIAGLFVLFTSLFFIYLLILNINIWLGLITFLIYVRGILILFSYFCSLESNTSFDIKNFIFPIVLIFFLINFITLFFFVEQKANYKNILSILVINEKIYFFSILLLLLILLFVILIININERFSLQKASE